MTASAQLVSPARLLADVVGRLIQVIDEENRVLAEKREHSLDSLIHKKSQLLLELMRVQKTLAPPPQGKTLEILRLLKTALEANQRLLTMHLSAAQEITETILEALRQGESDGTYAGGVSAYYSAP